MGHAISMSSDFFGQPLGMVWFCEIYLFVTYICILYTVKISSKISNPIIYSALPIRACHGIVCVGETWSDIEHLDDLDGEVGRPRHLATQKVKRFRHGCHIWAHIEELGGAAEMIERMLSHDCKASFRSLQFLIATFLQLTSF